MRAQRKQSIPIYAYCVLRMDAEEPWQVFPGIGDRSVFLVREGKLAMLVSRLDGRFTTDAHSIIQHGRVVHRVFEQQTVLPFRFGTTFKTELQVRHLLLGNRSGFLEALNRLRGKAEMHVKLLFAGHPELRVAGAAAATGVAHDKAAPAAVPAADGSEFLRHASQRVAGLFHHVQEHISVRPLRNGEWLVDFAHLIEGSRVPSYQRAGSQAAAQMKDCQMLVSGPWPPYHFLPSGIRMPAASEARLFGGRRIAKRAASIVPAQVQAQAAKA